MKNTRLSTVFIAASAASLLMASAVSFAGHRAHRMSGDMNYKGENFKAEVPAPCPPVMLLRDGFYVGIGAGYDAAKVEQHSTFDDPLAGVSGDYRVDHALTGWVGQIFAGYGRYFDTFYLGAEIAAGVSNAKGRMSATFNDPSDVPPTALVGDFHVRERTSYKAGIIPGVKVNDSTLLYVRGDYIRTQFKGHVDLYDEGVAVFAGHSGKWRNGYDYGVGMETYLAENVSARGEFTHAVYRSVKTKHFNVAGTQIGRTSLSPTNNEFMLSLIYHA